MSPTRIGPYEVLSVLGAGGMGKVYRARDPRLGREVAVKVLSSDAGGALKRFEQEALAASALNHPNIVTIHEIGEDAGHPYITMELVFGKSLRELVDKGPLPLRKALQIATQVASGLAAAHEKGIVHRDLKPENVVVTPDGLVKILDFGLVKLMGPAGAVPGQKMLTQTGFVVGTPSYMSPEQARGEEVDYRSDQFSLGSVLYELITGLVAFDKPTAVQTMTAILEEEPVPVRHRLPKAPEALGWILERCLAKDARERYTATRDLQEDLRRLEDRLSDAHGALQATVELAPPPVGRPSRAPSFWLLLASGAALLLGGVLLGRRLAPAPAGAPSLRYLTYSGSDTGPAASPDGRTIAFTSTRDGVRRIWLKQLADGAEAPLTAGPDDWPRFSPDGASILFTRFEGADGAASLYKVPAVGGEPRKLVSLGVRGDWSPDGRRLAYFVKSADRTGVELAVSASDGSSARVVSSERGAVVSSPRFSPDGSRLIYASGNGTFGNAWSLVTVSLLGEKPVVQRLAPPSNAGGLSAASWVSKDLVVYGQSTSVLPGVSTGQVFLHDLASGEKRPLLGSLSLGDGFEVLGGGRLVFSAEAFRSNLREVSIRGGSDPRWLTRGQSADREPVYSPDGKRAVFSSNREGNLDLWEVVLATGAVRRLTEDAAEDWDPHLTRDGRRLIWSSRRTGHFEIWSAAPDGSGATQVTRTGTDAENPSATPDGSWIVYGAYEAGNAGIWKVRADGSGAARLVAGEIGSPEVSPDGQYVLYLGGEGVGGPTVTAIRLSDGAPVGFSVEMRFLAGPPTLLLGRCRWFEDGRAVAFVGLDDRDRIGVFAQDFRPGEDTTSTRRKLAGFDLDDQTESFGISPDGSKLVLAQRGRLANLVLVDGLGPALGR